MYYWLLRIDSNSTSPKNIWENLDLLLRKSDDAAAPSADDALQTEDFSKFFTDKISQIRKETDGVPDTEYASSPGASFSMFQPTTDNRQTARGPDSGCSKQALFIRPCSNVADKKTLPRCCRRICWYCLIDHSRRPTYRYLRKRRSSNH